MIKRSIIFLIAMILISIDAFSQRGYVRYYPSRDYHYSQRVVHDPYYDNVVVYRRPTRVVHVENVHREQVYVHHKVEREYIHVNDEPYNDEVPNRKVIIDDGEDYIPISDMWELPIHFKRNSSVLNDDVDRNTCSGDLSIYSAVRFLRDHPYTNITLYAYADMQTGNEEDNYYLASQRGKAVYNRLVRNYNISPNRIHIRVMGSDTQYYSNNRWNRCVIIKAD